jgi:preprotein translocase subunit SecA
MLFRKKNAKRYDDRVWTAEVYKFQGICDEILEEMANRRTVIALAHFEKTMEKLNEAIKARGIQHDESTDSWEVAQVVSSASAEPRLLAILSELLPGPEQISQMPEGEHSSETRVHMVVAEHYPLPEGDARILTYAEKLPFYSTVRFHASLDEPLLKAFGADRTFSLLSRFGWKKDKPLSNSKVTSAIASGQARVKKVSIADERVSSQDEWFHYNCPTSRNRKQ